MAHKSIIIFAILFALITSHNAHSQWVQTGGPLVGNVYSIVSTSKSLFASTDDGVYRSDDDGANWQAVSNYIFHEYGARPILAVGDLLFAENVGEIFRSSDLGKTWVRFYGGGSPIGLMFFYKGVFLLGGYSRVKYSNDTGKTWNSGAGDVSNYFIDTYAASGDTLYAGFTNYVYQSVDSAKNWTPTIGHIPGIVFSLLPMGKDYFVGTGTGMFHYHFDSKDWILIDSVLPKRKVYSLYQFGGNFFAGTDSGVYISKNKGLNWTKQYLPLLFGTATGFIGSHNKLLAATAQGVYISDDSGKNWRRSNTGMTLGAVKCLGSILSDLFASFDPHYFMGSASVGDNWFNINIPNPDVFSLLTSGTSLYVGTRTGLYVTTDVGASWTKPTVDSTIGAVSAIALNGNDMYVGESIRGVHRSTDGGTSWSRANTGLERTFVVALHIKGSTVFAGSNYYDSTFTGLYRTTNKGVDWQHIAIAGAGDIFAITGDSTDIFVGGIGGVFRSSDDGLSWSLPSNSISRFTVRSLLISNNKLIAGTDSSGIFISSDKGATWSNANDGLPIIGVKALIQVYYTIFAGTDGRGIWKRDAKQLGVSLPKVQASSISLTATPNPFSESTTATFTTQSRAQTKVSIYDLLGNEIAVLFNGSLDPGSIHINGMPATLRRGCITASSAQILLPMRYQ